MHWSKPGYAQEKPGYALE